MPVEKALASPEMRCYDSRPAQLMKCKEDLHEYDNEINSFRKHTCHICLEEFSNRPLEGFNCVYRKTEKEFKDKNGIDTHVAIGKNETLFKDYLKYVSGQIATVAEETRRDVECNGMHIFHKSCLRRYIQMEALDPMTKNILCPICREIVYNQSEKMAILSNLNEVACQLLLNMEHDLLSERDDDSMINLKRDDRIRCDQACNQDLSKLTGMEGFKQYVEKKDGERNKFEEYCHHLKDYILLQGDELNEPKQIIDMCCKQVTDDMCKKVTDTFNAGYKETYKAVY